MDWDQIKAKWTMATGRMRGGPVPVSVESGALKPVTTAARVALVAGLIKEKLLKSGGI